MEVYLDTAQGTAYASRNHNDIEQVWKTDNKTERYQVDWMLTLKQQVPKLKKSKFAASVPSFHTVREKAENTTAPEEGAYHTRWRNKTEMLPTEDQTYEKYQNYAETRHMLQNNMQGRVSSGGCPEINWQLNLRGGMNAKPDLKWKRYFQRSHQSFDLAPTNFEKYDKHWTSPIQTKYERNNNALPIACIRDDPLKQDRWPGCEGTSLNTWEHLVADRKHGHKSRNNIKWETTLREKAGYLENLGSRIQDNRSEGCITEMLGKKKWSKAFPVQNDLARPYRDGGDPKLHVIQPSLGEPDDKSLELRRHKQPRKKKPDEE